MRHRNSETNYWAGRGGTHHISVAHVCLVRQKTCYFSSAPCLMRHINNLCGTCKRGMPVNNLPPIASFILVEGSLLRQPLLLFASSGHKNKTVAHALGHDAWMPVLLLPPNIMEPKCQQSLRLRLGLLDTIDWLDCLGQP
jgi:hypothetical protein